MYVSAATVLDAVSYFQNGRWVDSAHKMEYFFLFLLLKRMGISVRDAVPNTDFSAGSGKKELVSETLVQTTALFDPSELPGKACSLDVFAFYDYSGAGNYKFFNRGTEWDSLATRIPDTIDNTLRDYFLDRVVEGATRFFTLKQNYLDIISGSSFLDGRRVNVYALAIWMYRFHDFDGIEGGSTLSFLNYLRDLFYTDYNITEMEASRMFVEEVMAVSFSPTRVTGQQIRGQLPGLTSGVHGARAAYSDMTPNIVFGEYIETRRRALMNADDIFNTLQRYHQVVLFGPPGTSKSYLAKRVSELEVGGKIIFDPEKVLTIQFHPSYSYENFVGGVRWDPDRERPALEEGHLLKLCKRADKDPGAKFLLIIDEINRGNLSNILGEAVIALDREYKVQLTDKLEVRDGCFYIPANLYLLGTMNSTDRSLALVDYALRRRFAFIRTDFDKRVLEEYYSGRGLSPEISHGGKTVNVVELSMKLNERVERVLGREMTLGHTYFMSRPGNWDVAGFLNQFNFVVLPMLEEYTFGKGGKLSEILGGLNGRFGDADVFMDAMLEYLTS